MRALLSTRERRQQRSGYRKPQHSSLIGNASTVSTQESPYGWAARGPRASKLPEPEKICKQLLFTLILLQKTTIVFYGIILLSFLFSIFSQAAVWKMSKSLVIFTVHFTI